MSNILIEKYSKNLYRQFSKAITQMVKNMKTRRSLLPLHARHLLIAELRPHCMQLGCSQQQRTSRALLTTMCVTWPVQRQPDSAWASLPRVRQRGWTVRDAEPVKAALQEKRMLTSPAALPSHVPWATVSFQWPPLSLFKVDRICFLNLKNLVIHTVESHWWPKKDKLKQWNIISLPKSLVNIRTNCNSKSFYGWKRKL